MGGHFIPLPGSPEPRRSGGSSSVLIFAGGALVAALLAGVGITLATSRPGPETDPSETYLASEADTTDAGTPEIRLSTGLAAESFGRVAVPPDPFEPSSPKAGRVGVQPVVQAFSAPVLPSVSNAPVPAMSQSSVVGRPGEAPVQNVRSLVAEATIQPPVITGIIHGETSVVIAKLNGQTHFVKAGERIGGSWLVEEVKEQSVILKNGERRVEVAVQGAQ